jgi:hypothetical protein
MISHIHTFVQLAFLLNIITNAFAISLDPNNCVGNLKSFTNCNNIDRITEKCSVVTGDQEAIDCFCTQELLNSYIG